MGIGLRDPAVPRGDRWRAALRQRSRARHPRQYRTPASGARTGTHRDGHIEREFDARQAAYSLIVEDDLALQKQMRWAFDASRPWSRATASAIAQLRANTNLRWSPWTLACRRCPTTSARVQAPARDPHARARYQGHRAHGQHDRENAIKAGPGRLRLSPSPSSPSRLNLTIERAFRMHDLQRRTPASPRRSRGGPLSGLLTRDPGMLKVCRTIEKLASASATVAPARRERYRQRSRARTAHAPARAASASWRSTAPPFPMPA